MNDSHTNARQPGNALDIRWLVIASMVPIGMILIAMFMKPLWRDEYWSLFFSMPNTSIDVLKREVHPPLYYYLLNGWRMIVPGDYNARFLSLFFIAIGAVHVWITMKEKRVAAIFLLLCISSYWVIYFSTEVRPYVLLFSLCAISSVSAVRFVESNQLWPHALVIFVVGCLMGMTHYFGALWHASLCLCLGTACLIQRQSVFRFVVFGVIGVVAILPTLTWIVFSLNDFDLSNQQSGRSFIDEAQFTINQILRGILIKWIGSNPAAFIAGAAGLITAFKLRNSSSSILVYASVLTIVISIIIHFTFVTLIKERAYIVIIPALTLILAISISNLKQKSGFASKSASVIPIFVAIMPFLFIPEYFKDREQLGKVTAYLQQFDASCQGSQIYGYYRPTNHNGFTEYVTQRVIRSLRDIQVVDVEKASTAIKWNDCPLRAIALTLPKRGGEQRSVADAALAEAGLKETDIRAVEFGQGRSVVWVAADTPTTN